MRRFIPLILLIAMIVTIVHSTEPVYALEAYEDTHMTTTEYVYPITPDSKDWDSYTVIDKVLMLQIPDSTLDSMSNDELVLALASYPYLIDIYLYGNSVQDGIEVVRTYCSALNELLERDPDLSSVNRYLTNMTNDYSFEESTNTNDIEFSYSALADIYLSVTSHSNQAQLYSSTYTTSYVYTPNETPVEVLTLTEYHTEDWHNTKNLEVVQSVYHAEVVDIGSCLYNCHYFAWHLGGDIDSDEHKWMNSPSSYMTDGSYSITYTGNINAPHYATNIRNGDIVFYGSTNNLSTAHSAICVEPSVTSNAIKYVHCISKWGSLGVFMHDMSSVPAAYDTSTISTWRLS